MIGAICGIGGGVLIKPVLDACNVMDVSAISFLSGCTVLTMSSYNVLSSGIKGTAKLDLKTSTPLAVGAAAGGIMGKMIFHLLTVAFPNQNHVGAVQAVSLMLVTIGTLIYTLRKNKIRTYRVTGWPVCVGIGLLLGVMSSFLGIGGGPINLVVLYFAFSMETKTAAANSLYIIFFSQIAALLQTLLSGSIPDVGVGIIFMMAACGLLGGMTGKRINRGLNGEMVERLFAGLMVLIILTCIYNIWHFMM